MNQIKKYTSTQHRQDGRRRELKKHEEIFTIGTNETTKK